MRLLGTIQRSLSRTSIGYEKDIYAATEIDEMEEMKHKMEEEAREIHEERVKIREIERKLKARFTKLWRCQENELCGEPWLKEKEQDRRKKIMKLNKMEVKVKKSRLKNTVVDRMKFFKIMSQSLHLHHEHVTPPSGAVVNSMFGLINSYTLSRDEIGHRAPRTRISWGIRLLDSPWNLDRNYFWDFKRENMERQDGFTNFKTAINLGG